MIAAQGVLYVGLGIVITVTPVSQARAGRAMIVLFTPIGRRCVLVPYKPRVRPRDPDGHDANLA
jgi:hypothetical protein